MSSSPDSQVNLGVFGWLNRLMIWLIILAAAGLIIAKYLPLIQKNVRLRQELQVKQEEVQRLQRERQANQQRIQQLQNDPRTVEREARERLGFARPDEQVVTFKEMAPAAGNPAAAPASPTRPPSPHRANGTAPTAPAPATPRP
ncbi:MAG: FtsB family cell division protein [Verrucomicrobiota bacterium]